MINGKTTDEVLEDLLREIEDSAPDLSALFEEGAASLDALLRELEEPNRFNGNRGKQAGGEQKTEG